MSEAFRQGKLKSTGSMKMAAEPAVTRLKHCAKAVSEDE